MLSKRIAPCLTLLGGSILVSSYQSVNNLGARHDSPNARQWADGSPMPIPKPNAVLMADGSPMPIPKPNAVAA